MWTYNTNELYHYGVLGMKWGIHRYRESPGSYTQRGLKKYEEASDEYQSRREKLKKAKDSKNREDIKTARREVKNSKKELNKSYAQLKMDKKADQGKRLYAKGKTISGNLKINAIAQIGIIAGSKITQSILSSYGDQKLAFIASNAVGIGGTIINAILAGKTIRDNNRLRAYYGHSRNK